MSKPGFVYVLINSALPELVKIGKTEGTPEDRARQLSSTGLPAPFVVAYKKYFCDCDSAEKYVHTLLESKGHRVTANREFFSAPISDAIDAVLAAHSNFANLPAVDDRQQVSADRDPNSHATGDQAWAALLLEADNARYGNHGEIQDKLLAIRLYEKAASLGAPEAFIALAELIGYGANGKGDSRRALDWLRGGATRDVWCWGLMSDAYLGKGWSNLNEPDNARKCLRKLFCQVDFSQLRSESHDDQEREYFFWLQEYIHLCESSKDDVSADLDTILKAADNLLVRIALLTDEFELSARQKAVQKLIKCATLMLPKKTISGVL